MTYAPTQFLKACCEYKLDNKNVARIKSGIMITVGVSVKIQKNIVCAKKGVFWNPATCSCKNGKYVRSIGDSVVICDEIIEKTKSPSTKIVLTKSTSTKTVLTNFYILLAFLLITIALLTAVSIYHI